MISCDQEEVTSIPMGRQIMHMLSRLGKHMYLLADIQSILVFTPVVKCLSLEREVIESIVSSWFVHSSVFLPTLEAY